MGVAEAYVKKMHFSLFRVFCLSKSEMRLLEYCLLSNSVTN